jgi:hypothetical protein
MNILYTPPGSILPFFAGKQDRIKPSREGGVRDSIYHLIKSDRKDKNAKKTKMKKRTPKSKVQMLTTQDV